MFGSDLFSSFLHDSVGNGLRNMPGDARATKRRLGTLGFFGDEVENDFITRELDQGVKAFQEDRGLRVDGYLYPGGETETGITQALSAPGRETESRPLFASVGNDVSQNNDDHLAAGSFGRLAENVDATGRMVRTEEENERPPFALPFWIQERNEEGDKGGENENDDEDNDGDNDDGGEEKESDCEAERKDLENAEIALAVAEAEVQRLEERVEEQGKDLEKFTKEQEKLEEERAAKEGEIEEIRAEIDQREREVEGGTAIGGIRGKKIGKWAGKAYNQLTTTQLEKRVAELEKELKKIDKALGELTKKIDEAQKEIDMLMSRYYEAQARVNEAQARVDEAQSALEDCEDAQS